MFLICHRGFFKKMHTVNIENYDSAQTDSESDSRLEKMPKKKEKKRPKKAKKEVQINPVINLDNETIMVLMRSRGLDKKLFVEFLNMPIFAGKPAGRRNPQYGDLVAKWQMANAKRKLKKNRPEQDMETPPSKEDEEEEEEAEETTEPGSKKRKKNHKKEGIFSSRPQAVQQAVMNRIPLTPSNV